MPDAEIAEAHRSAEVFAEVEEMTAPLNAFLALIHAFDWLNIRDRDGKAALSAYFDGNFGDPIGIALGDIASYPLLNRGKRISAMAGVTLVSGRRRTWFINADINLFY